MLPSGSWSWRIFTGICGCGSARFFREGIAMHPRLRAPRGARRGNFRVGERETVLRPTGVRPGWSPSSQSGPVTNPDFPFRHLVPGIKSKNRGIKNKGFRNTPFECDLHQSDRISTRKSGLFRPLWFEDLRPDRTRALLREKKGGFPRKGVTMGEWMRNITQLHHTLSKKNAERLRVENSSRLFRKKFSIAIMIAIKP